MGLPEGIVASDNVFSVKNGEGSGNSFSRDLSEDDDIQDVPIGSYKRVGTNEGTKPKMRLSKDEGYEAVDQDYPYHQLQYLREQSRNCFPDDEKPKDPLIAVPRIYCKSCGENLSTGSENRENSGYADPGMPKNVDTDSVVCQGVLTDSIDYMAADSVPDGVGYDLRRRTSRKTTKRYGIDYDTTPKVTKISVIPTTHAS